jgi:hypothetical protein
MNDSFGTGKQGNVNAAPTPTPAIHRN